VIKKVLTSLAGDAPELSRDHSKPGVVDSIETWVSVLVIWNLRADLGDTELLDLIRGEESELD